MTLSDTTEQLRRDRVLLEAIIDDPTRLGPDFQPIIRLADGSRVAHKATGRGQSGTDLDSTLALLDGAKATGLVERLDWAFRCLAFDVALSAAPDLELHLTPEPDTFGSLCPPRLAATFGRGRRALRVAAEVHEDAFAPGLDLLGAAQEWRGWGWRIVVADVADLVPDGLLARLDALRPDAVSIDLSRPGRAGDPRVREVREWAVGSGVELHAVGLDTGSLRQQAIDLGVVLGRGRALGPPASLV